MVDEVAPLILDFLEWLAREPRPYVDVMDAWRTSCPRLTVWEDSLERGFVTRTRRSGRDALVEITPAGRAFLAASDGRRAAATSVPARTALPSA
jgi:hypothetical protein